MSYDLAHTYIVSQKKMHMRRQSIFWDILYWQHIFYKYMSLYVYREAYNICNKMWTIMKLNDNVVFNCGSDLFTGDEEGAPITYMLPSLWTSRPILIPPPPEPITPNFPNSTSNAPKYLFILRGQSFAIPTFFTIFKFSTSFFDFFDSSWDFFLESLDLIAWMCQTVEKN